MTNLIDKNIGVQNNEGLNEFEAWGFMLKKSQLLLTNAYHAKDGKLVDKYKKDIDFIQKQIIRLKN